MKILILLSLAVVAVSAVQPRFQRIVGGSVTTISKYPYAVAMLYSRSGSGTFYLNCGGTIINNRSVLSAAHCFIGNTIRQWRMRVGSTNSNSGGVVHNTNAIIIHPQYNSRILDNDVAVIRTNSAFNFNANVARGSIASSNYWLPDNAPVWAIGWGWTSSNGPASIQLREVQLYTVNLQTCINRYREINNVVNANMLCVGILDVGGRDQCGGDSGGPLLHNNAVVGVCSWGHMECAHPRYPGVNALVSRYTSWIQANA
ncbi:trypsin, alkaline C-like [Pieris napi]|uniref:trypsin, alkaline C-like n=1 Tax=Pieris napi TaxID=78633 RepID=UPI001FBB7CEC|nr:trypsin, alkaline C-like [Pieris napi]